MDKNEILDLYLNIIYVGPNIYGVETGAQYYFSKSAKDLSLEECAFLAGKVMDIMRAEDKFHRQAFRKAANRHDKR